MNKNKFNVLRFNDDEIDNELLDVLIKAGSHEYITNSILEIPDKELSDAKFSKELDKRMHQYFATMNKDNHPEKIRNIFIKTKNVMLRVAAVLFVFVILAVGFVATSEATQIKLLNIYMKNTDIDTSFEFMNPAPTDAKDESNSIEKIFWYIPDEFELVFENHDNNFQNIVFQSADGGYIDIKLITNGTLNIDTEQGKSYYIEVGDYDCYVSENEAENIVIFQIDNINYYILGNISVEEIIKIVENIKN